MKFLTLFVCSFVLTYSYAQTLEWLVPSGGLKSDKGTTIVVDSEGNSYITGYYNEEATFGTLNTGFSYFQSKEAFVAKLDPQGNFIWQTNGINYYDDRGLGLTIDDQGNTYVTGTCWGGLQWGPLNNYCPASYSDQIFVTKIDPNGIPVWMKNAGNCETGGIWYNDDHGQDLSIDANGNIFVTGFISNMDGTVENAYFDQIAVPIQPYDSLAFVAKLDPAGNWQWVETFGGIFEQRDNAITVDDEGNVYVAGGYWSSKTFGTENLSSQNGSSDIYVVKYDNDGNFQWVQHAEGPLDDRANGIVDGHDGYMYVTGEFRDTTFFGNIMMNNAGGPSGRDVFVAKLSKDGEWKWVVRGGSKKGKDRGNYITSNDQSTLFVAGQYSGNADFGIFDVDSDGDSVEIFIAAIDTSGYWRWIVEGGGYGYDRAQGIAADANCNVYAIGYFDDEMTVQGNTLQPYRGKDIFTLKISDACPASIPPPLEDEPEEFCFVEVPNTFTPNGDGINPYVSFTNSCNADFEAIVMNRWGETVYRTGDPQALWDGTNNQGEPLTEGVYFYRIEVKYISKDPEVHSGFIHIYR